MRNYRTSLLQILNNVLPWTVPLQSQVRGRPSSAEDLYSPRSRQDISKTPTTKNTADREVVDGVVVPHLTQGKRGGKEEQEKKECCISAIMKQVTYTVLRLSSGSSINHGRGCVNAQWLCSAGGLSLWMPGLQPWCSYRVPFPLIPQCFVALKWLSFYVLSVHIRLSPLSFSHSNPLFPCPWNLSLNFQPLSIFRVFLQHISLPPFPRRWLWFLRYSARSASASQHSKH